MVGFISLLGLSLAAGMEITAMIPEGMQVGGWVRKWVGGRTV